MTVVAYVSCVPACMADAWSGLVKSESIVNLLPRGPPAGVMEGVEFVKDPFLEIIFILFQLLPNVHSCHDSLVEKLTCTSEG